MKNIRKYINERNEFVYNMALVCVIFQTAVIIFLEFASPLY